MELIDIWTLYPFMLWLNGDGYIVGSDAHTYSHIKQPCKMYGVDDR